MEFACSCEAEQQSMYLYAGLWVEMLFGVCVAITLTPF